MSFEKIEEYEAAEAAALKLNPFFASKLILALLESGKVSYTEFTNLYVDILQERQRKDQHDKAALILHLGLCSVGDAEQFRKQGRKLLYEKGYYTGLDGSELGKMLELEFKKPQDNDNTGI